MSNNVSNSADKAVAEKPEKWTGKIAGAGVGFVLGGAIGYVLLGYGGVFFAGVVCALLGGALGAAFDADALAGGADLVFAHDPAELGFVEAWAGVIFFTFQIYFDFSGYSDMAIGLARMFGFRLLENFNEPYIATTMTEFWRRWHMSLTGWIREYLYFSLGGNRRGALRTHFNLWLCFLASGLWHGAAWNYIAWRPL